MWYELILTTLVLILIYRRRIIGNYSSYSVMMNLAKLMYGGNNAKIIHKSSYIEVQYEIENQAYTVYIKRDLDLNRIDKQLYGVDRHGNKTLIKMENDIPFTMEPQDLGFIKMVLIDENNEVSDLNPTAEEL